MKGATEMWAEDNPNQSARWDSWAEEFDVWNSAADPTDAVNFLSSCVGQGRALELGVGTGRVAIPLALKGAEVHGVDISSEMLQLLREKPDGDQVHVWTQSMDERFGQDEYDLVYCVYSSFFSLLTQPSQRACLTAVAEALRPGGVAVFEQFVPGFNGAFETRNSVHPRNVRQDSVGLTVTRTDLIGQRIDFQELTFANGSAAQVLPVSIRYTWPSEFYLMAELAGLSVVNEYDDWDEHEFDFRSKRIIATLQKG